jgi:hypothetical protein
LRYCVMLVSYSDGEKIKLGQAGQDLKDIRGHLKVAAIRKYHMQPSICMYVAA